MSAPPEELPAAGLTLSIQLGPSTARQPLEPPAAAGPAPRGAAPRPRRPQPPPGPYLRRERERDRATASSRRCDVTRARRARPSPQVALPQSPQRRCVTHGQKKNKQKTKNIPAWAVHEAKGIPALLTLS